MRGSARPQNAGYSLLLCSGAFLSAGDRSNTRKTKMPLDLKCRSSILDRVSARYETLSCRGRTHFGWPWWGINRALDMLRAGDDFLLLSSRLGELRFQPGQILHIERASLFPCLRNGIVIAHWHTGFPNCVGFMPKDIGTTELLVLLE